jgi:septal ring factor EnvC (AmiA/AmiB activator)
VRRRENQTVTPGEKSVARNETLPSNAFDGGDFAALRGKLNLPVRGDVTNRFGATREDTGVSWKGLFIKSAEGSDVKSVASGRVVFADWLRGFGNLLIIDHGDGYMSLYGNNQAILKKVGDTVKGGDTVASVGNSGGNETSGLYFELRYQSKPFDPLSWSVVK